MLVHRCDRCCVYKKEIQPCRTKYRGIWAILMHKIMFPSESCNSVSKGNPVRFPLSRKFSPRVPPFGNRCFRQTKQQTTPYGHLKAVLSFHEYLLELQNRTQGFHHGVLLVVLHQVCQGVKLLTTSNVVLQVMLLRHMCTELAY